MPELIIKQIDAFTTKPFCGNPAGVVTCADGLAVDTMQKIACEMCTLESTFVTSPESNNASYRIRFFTPSFEYDFSGHAMVATCFALAEDGYITLSHGVKTVLFETNIGNIPADFHFDEQNVTEATEDETNRIALKIGGKIAGSLEKIMIHRTVHEYRPASVPVAEIADILGIKENEISKSGLPVEIVSSGLVQLVVPVLHKEALINMSPDLIRLKIMNQKIGVQTSDIFTLDALHTDCITYSRHFSPATGMWEDIGSGAGAASIGTFLLRHGVVTPGSLIMEQGKEIDKLSKVFVEVDSEEDGSIPLRVGGLAVTSITRSLEIEEERIAIR